VIASISICSTLLVRQQESTSVRFREKVHYSPLMHKARCSELPFCQSVRLESKDCRRPLLRHLRPRRCHCIVTAAAAGERRHNTTCQQRHLSGAVFTSVIGSTSTAHLTHPHLLQGSHGSSTVLRRKITCSGGFIRQRCRPCPLQLGRQQQRRLWRHHLQCNNHPCWTGGGVAASRQRTWHWSLDHWLSSSGSTRST